MKKVIISNASLSVVSLKEIKPYRIAFVGSPFNAPDNALPHAIQFVVVVSFSFAYLMYMMVEMEGTKKKLVEGKKTVKRICCEGWANVCVCWASCWICCTGVWSGKKILLVGVMYYLCGVTHPFPPDSISAVGATNTTTTRV